MTKVPALPAGFLEKKGPGGRLWILRDGIPFDLAPARWDAWLAGEEGTVLTREGGRSPSRLLELPGVGAVVVRRYVHGGALARITRDLFPGWGRAARELQASERIRRHGVATPEILAVYSREALPGLRRSCLVSRLVPGGLNLREWLRRHGPGGAAGKPVARDVARAVASLHGAGCWHRDLNLGNLLLAAGRIWILDLDGAVLKEKLGIRDRAKNLLRLHRSLCKESAAREPLSARERLAFLRSYAGSDGRLFRDLVAWMRDHGAVHALRKALSVSRVSRRTTSPGPS